MSVIVRRALYKRELHELRITRKETRDNVTGREQLNRPDENFPSGSRDFSRVKKASRKQRSNFFVSHNAMLLSHRVERDCRATLYRSSIY
jgi:hypothetical protein